LGVLDAYVNDLAYNRQVRGVKEKET